MNAQDEASGGELQEAAIELRRETHRGQQNVTFTRGFVCSQAFVDRDVSAGPISTRCSANAVGGFAWKNRRPAPIVSC